MQDRVQGFDDFEIEEIPKNYFPEALADEIERDELLYPPTGYTGFEGDIDYDFEFHKHRKHFDRNYGDDDEASRYGYHDDDENEMEFSDGNEGADLVASLDFHLEP
mmetsp:Transcript_30717/g.40855  ORF Transcript_30717/g.40855 Transcript_30717/m.40855 type:complete len:106 (+) Transcript_30717:2297-2614(+)